MKRILTFGCLGLLAAGVGLIVLVMVVGSRAGGTTATASPSPKTAATRVAGAIGQRVESAGIAVTTNSTSQSDTLSVVQKVKLERTYVIVDVTIENTTRDKAPYNPAYFKIKDADGYEYSAQLAGPDNYLKSGDLSAGESVRGVVAFDVPLGARGLVLSYQPAVILGGYQPIRVALD